MLKSILENTPMYWLSLAKVPSYIINSKMRHKMTSFMWNSISTEGDNALSLMGIYFNS